MHYRLGKLCIDFILGRIIQMCSTVQPEHILCSLWYCSRAQETKTVEFASSIDPDEASHNEAAHLDYVPSST